tara:strand:- start:103 stop:543 length:441 start_codon:yes stop_codon:yes gene_type:complete
MAWGYHGGASTAPGTAGGHYAGPGYIGNQSPAHHSPYIKTEEEIKQDILRDRHKQLYGTGSSGLTQSMPSTIKDVNATLNTGSTLNSIINFIQGRIGNSTATINVPGRRINLNVPLLNAGGGMISGQGSWSPYGNNFLGFQYKKSW